MSRNVDGRVKKNSHQRKAVNCESKINTPLVLTEHWA